MGARARESETDRQTEGEKKACAPTLQSGSGCEGNVCVCVCARARAIVSDARLVAVFVAVF